MVYILLFDVPSHLVVSDHAKCAPLPKSLENAGGCPSSGAIPEFGPNLSDAQLVTAVASHGSSTYVAREFSGIPFGYASLV